MEQAIEYFTVFGGTDEQIDTTIPIEDSIQELILDEYKYYRNEVADICTSDPLLQAILSGIALGDRRTNSSFRRAKVSFKNGMECVEELRDMGALKVESTMHHLTNQANQGDISKKLIITTPFLRFWFAFVSPIFKGIRDGDYKEFLTNFKNQKEEFQNYIFEQLCHEFLKKQFNEDDAIYSQGRYWDDEGEVELVAKTTSRKIIAGICKYTNTKMKKSVLTNLKKECEDIQLPVDVFVLFAKSGFSSELKSLKSEELRLFTAKSLKALIYKHGRYYRCSWCIVCTNYLLSSTS
jgi:hypothetical protein